jgi:hypothetical protein
VSSNGFLWHSWGCVLLERLPIFLHGKWLFLQIPDNDISFKIIYEIENVKKRESELSSRVIAAEYKISSNFYKTFYFKTKKNETEGYFDEKKEFVKSAF